MLLLLLMLRVWSDSNPYASFDHVDTGSHRRVLPLAYTATYDNKAGFGSLARLDLRMRFTGPACVSVLAAGLLLGTCIAHDAPSNDVDLEPADDGGSGSQQVFHAPDATTSLNSVVDPAQRRAREGQCRRILLGSMEGTSLSS